MSAPKKQDWVPTSHAPTPSLVRSLARAGWGELGGHHMRGRRLCLDTLAKSFVADGSGAGSATLEQIAYSAQYSVRWVRACLGDLESLGIIEWTRGGIQRGRHVPSFFRIVKSRLVELIKAARRLKGEHEARVATATEERLEKSGAKPWATLKPKRKKKDSAASRGSLHAEVAADLLTSDEGGTDLPQEGAYQFSPETSVADRLSINEAAQRAHDLTQWQSAYGAQGTLLASGAAAGGTASSGAGIARALLADLNPTLLGKIDRATRKRAKHGR